ncbi:hypothetical protein ACFZBM_02080 [Streptomyces lavendulae]|uniref:Uncharacterized protein n=1 Tax=Streptomyces lavendulae subsp. lavendulae TaxID=58340 RepID=A0A2K8P8Q1_STRLA|nr:hypothetical protein [Streptomyces lavendulae]ATZ23119.1 hypothetical protein SLAV_06070 [Streptomyces lavendulae subsp. lavendulae]QUQ52956.1 hypothetical protein SLLC_04095 [Streptomyces lavendulae subsp. lavendulae]
MPRNLKFASVALAGVLAATGLTAATASPAAAAQTCPWPYVCFLDGNENILTMYKDTGWQPTSAKTRTARWVTDSRNQDCAYLKYASGYVDQIRPGQSFGLGSGVVEINITNGCP